jgi:hypothetical protein
LTILIENPRQITSDLTAAFTVTSRHIQQYSAVCNKKPRCVTACVVLYNGGAKRGHEYKAYSGFANFRRNHTTNLSSTVHTPILTI